MFYTVDPKKKEKERKKAPLSRGKHSRDKILALCYFANWPAPLTPTPFKEIFHFLFPGETKILYRYFHYLVVNFNNYNIFKPQWYFLAKWEVSCTSSFYYFGFFYLLQEVNNVYQYFKLVSKTQWLLLYLGLITIFWSSWANTLKHCQKIHNIWLDKHLTNERSTPRKLTTPV